MAQFQETKSYYTDVFYPPDGYNFDFAEITTFSLAKSILLQIYAMAISAKQRKGTLHRPNSTIRTQTEDRSELFHIFYDGKHNLELTNDEEYQTASGKLSLYLHNKCCTPVKISNGLFHPKIMLIQFKNDKNEFFYRVLISSKNLTWSNYFEAGVLLESSNEILEDNSNQNLAGPALARFFKNYYNETNPKIKSKIDLKVLAKTKFKVVCPQDEQCSEPEIYFGKEYNLLELIKEDMKNDKTHLRVVSMKPDETLFEKSDNIKIQYICNFKDFYKPQEDKNLWECDPNKKDNHWYIATDEYGKNPLPLHIKQYLLWKEDYSNLSVWIGSANCSENGLKGINEEVLVHYTQKNLDKNYFPCNDPNHADIYSDIKFKHPKSVENPNIPEIDEDEFPHINVTAKDAKYENYTLYVTIINNTNTEISVRPATFEDETVVMVGENKLTFEEMEKSKFSPLLLVNVVGDDRTYSITLNIEWQGEEIKILRKNLPPDPIEKLADLICPPEKGLFSNSDGVYERLQKCRFKQNDTDFQSTIDNALNEIDNALNELEEFCKKPSDKDTDIIKLANHSFYKTHKTDIETMEKMLRCLKENSNEQ